MRSTWVSTIRLAAVLFLVGMGSNRLANAVPWDIFDDPNSASTCDAVNASNVELVVLSDTGQLVIITGTDLVLTATFVDADGFVFFGGLPVGVIDFAEDGDGLRTLWWTSLNGTVVEVDLFTGEPSTTDLLPSDFHGVPCDACELWDDPADCVGDQDGDGIIDVVDACPDTPPDEPVDIDGCSCSQTDTDADGVDDCVDDCPDTPPDEPVDEDGCACFEVDSDGDGIDDCDDECPFDFGDDDFGCPCDAFDEDDDGINDCLDDCPNTPPGADVDADGCEIVVVLPLTPVSITCGGFSGLSLAMTLGLLVSLRLSRRRW